METVANTESIRALLRLSFRDVMYCSDAISKVVTFIKLNGGDGSDEKHKLFAVLQLAMTVFQMYCNFYRLFPPTYQ